MDHATKIDHNNNKTNELLKTLIEKLDKIDRNEKLTRETQEAIKVTQEIAIANSKGIEDIKKLAHKPFL